MTVLKVYLANMGGEVTIPDAVEMVQGETDALVSFVDSDGKVLVTFRRADLAVLTHDVSLYSRQADGTDGSRSSAGEE